MTYKRGTAGWYIERALARPWRWRQRRHWKQTMPNLYAHMEQEKRA